ncbi:MAG: hypothetical protein FWG36_09420 [Oscillospiraceae bacterium]|nr:hypothetical protein [Oscillospiraceae bacterium]
MESKAYYVSLEKNPLISMKVIPGHFTTNNAHINNYLDFSGLKSNAKVARDVARELALPYISIDHVDTIVTIENTNIIAAYIADELLHHSTSVTHEITDVYVVTPMNNTAGQMTFYDSEIDKIRGKNILLLATSISSGRTLETMLECISYYGGRTVGMSSLFLASQEWKNKGVNTLFTPEDIKDYKLYAPVECEMCRSGQALDAIVTSEGYSKLL